MRRSAFLAGIAAAPVAASLPLPKSPPDYAAMVNALVEREWAWKTKLYVLRAEGVSGSWIERHTVKSLGQRLAQLAFKHGYAYTEYEKVITAATGDGALYEIVDRHAPVE